MVAVYQYMRLRGYPADKISILTTYNGQRALISDVIESRCARHPAFGRPLKVRPYCGSLIIGLFVLQLPAPSPQAREIYITVLGQSFKSAPIRASATAPNE